DQPQPCALTQVEELRFGRVLRPWPAVQWTVRLGREVSVLDLRGAGCGPCVAGDFDRTLVVVEVDDDDLLVSADTVGAHPHRLTEQAVWHRVLARFEGHHRRIDRHLPGSAERDR